MTKVKNLAKFMYRGADVGTKVVISIPAGASVDVSDEMADYLCDNWPKDWEIDENDSETETPESDDEDTDGDLEPKPLRTHRKSQRNH